MDYHEAFNKSAAKNVATLAVLAAEMLSQHIPAAAAAAAGGSSFDVERYIKSSARCSFAKLDESGNAGGNSMMVVVEDDPSDSETLMYVAAQTKEMARVEKDCTHPFLLGRDCRRHSSRVLRYLLLQAVRVQDGRLPQQ